MRKVALNVGFLESVFEKRISRLFTMKKESLDLLIEH